jgi:hypothetical protein
MRTLGTVILSFAVGASGVLLAGCPFGGMGNCDNYCDGHDPSIVSGLYEPFAWSSDEDAEPTAFDIVQVEVSEGDEVIVTFTDLSGEEHTAVYAGGPSTTSTY